MLESQAVRWLPKDFVETSSTGGACTLVAYAVMLILFMSELTGFMTASYSTLLMLDRMDGDMLQINFDVDLLDVDCRNLKVAVFAQASEERVSTWSQDFWLRPVDNKGRVFGMASRPQERSPYEDEGEAEHKRVMQKLRSEDGKQELDSDWSSSHDGFNHKSFEHVIEAHDFTLINFFAGWCGHCQRFAPLWGQMADRINGNDTLAAPEFPDRDGKMRRVRLIRMNCVDFKQLCHDKGIDAYPTIRLYKADGSFSVFEGKREEVEITRWLERTVKMKSYGWAANHEAFEHGCNAKGRLLVPRMPGHLEFTAGTGDQNLNVRMANVSHLVKHLSFSDPENGKYHRKGWVDLPRDVVAHVTPIDGQSFVTHRFHEAWVHDMKVVSTVSPRGTVAYQVSHQKRLSRLPEDVVPQTQFHFDIEPFSIWVKREDKKWYDLTTSILAIVGGAFVIMRLLSRGTLLLLSLRLLGSRSKGSARGGSLNIGAFD
mmetsp:Transcript_90203/g.209882  ORF Transcript_90203/g.209882 Transcript_90203/m.209882 type:complete len:485 (+) Transcript_90203:1-1455(+)